MREANLLIAEWTSVLEMPYCHPHKLYLLEIQSFRHLAELIFLLCGLQGGSISTPSQAGVQDWSPFTRMAALFMKTQPRWSGPQGLWSPCPRQPGQRKIHFFCLCMIPFLGLFLVVILLPQPKHKVVPGLEVGVGKCHYRILKSLSNGNRKQELSLPNF